VTLAVVAASLSLIAAGPPLDGTRAWPMPADPAREMVEGLHRYLDRETRAALARRDGRWDRVHTSADAYVKSVEPQRERLAAILGTTDERIKPVTLTFLAGPGVTAPLVSNDAVKVTAVRWTVYPGFEAEGLLVEPAGAIEANVVALPDADTPPERLVWAAPGSAPESATALRLAEAGCRVLVPTLIDRSTEFSGSPLVRFTNLSHREWIYRMAYETGRHVIGYEVDEVRAAIDWFTRDGEPKRPIGVFGTGEGGMIALHAAAVDRRIDAAWVAGHFGPREAVWSEPVYRNVWNLLNEFGDAEVASLVSPRALTIEACRGPEIAGPPPPVGGRGDAASGRLTTPSREAVNVEFRRLGEICYQGDGARPAKLFPADSSQPLHVGRQGLESFLADLQLTRARDRSLPADPRRAGHEGPRMGRLVADMVGYTQSLLRASELRRDAYWSKANGKSAAAWEASLEPYRTEFSEELIGRLRPFESPRSDVLSAQVYDEPKWTGYAIQLPMEEDVFASGVLLLPKDLEPGEKRPVVVCQHGLEGTPKPIVDPRVKSPYNSFGARLADLGYIVYAPQNPYIGGDRFRQLQRKANPLGKSLFSTIIAQHTRTLDWLKSRPEVDPARIAFYGLSYGGKTAMRVPAALKDYCLSICSADFNEWAVKCTNIERKYSYLYTIEYDMYEFGLAERFNYAEMAGLIAPRPFMVERGHDDGVAPDEWVAYEYAKVRRLYDKLGIGDRTGLAVFNGGHQIDGRETFAFLAKHLNWPRGQPQGRLEPTPRLE
jgi:dienelactone hydrolase